MYDVSCLQLVRMHIHITFSTQMQGFFTSTSHVSSKPIIRLGRLQLIYLFGRQRNRALLLMCYTYHHSVHCNLIMWHQYSIIGWCHHNFKVWAGLVQSSLVLLGYNVRVSVCNLSTKSNEKKESVLESNEHQIYVRKKFFSLTDYWLISVTQDKRSTLHKLTTRYKTENLNTTRKIIFLVTITTNLSENKSIVDLVDIFNALLDTKIVKMQQNIHNSFYIDVDDLTITN